jgi:hypothetical protein
VPISYFFEASDAGEPQRYIVRKNDRRLLRLTASGVVKEALTPAEKGELELYELTLNPGGSSGTDFFQHTGEKAATSLSGSLRLWLDHEAHVWRRATASASEHRAAHVRQPDAAGRARHLGDDAAPRRSPG